MNKKYLIIGALSCVAFFSACKKNNNNGAEIEEIHPDDLPPIDNSIPSVNILWNHASAKKVSHTTFFSDYGRIHRAADGNLVMAYGFGPDVNNTRISIAVKRSTDNGVTWSEPNVVMNGVNQANYTGFANPEMLVMKNGWLMLAFEGKGKPDDNNKNNMQFIISKDNGLTWGQPQIVAKGRAWEPGMIQLPDGEIEMFWSSEAKWWPSSDVQQEILMARSKDNGATWATPETVAYTYGMRDGMPTPVILKDNKGMIFTIESIRDGKSPYVLWSSMAARWKYKTLGTSTNGRRWLSTVDNIFGAGPHLLQLETGETLISFHSKDGRNVSNFHKEIMLVYRGNGLAKNAVRISDPWLDLPLDQGAYYSQMFMKDQKNIIMATTRSFANGSSEVWTKEGRIVHNLPKAKWTVKEFSSEEPSNNRLADRLLDNDPTTFWITRYSVNATNYPNHFVTIDMGEKLELDGFSVAQKPGDRKIATMEILTSDDNITFTSRGTFTLKTKDREEHLLPLPAKISARYFKLVPKTGADAQRQPGLAEVGAFTFD
ncbi:exo-alpha-sialidase [Pedobacter xixiisoli]|uniref:F5/8 type C domain-containing protein n=1 Tax=Pedobacter xixiisoli TaxID=1476464 RepID=A0A285ZUN5_9SPHI|nr:exo-alpha-sialidase [Pedobacter xixiisoli]SOD13364.1 F5/8 type C domain-containing protein [Pedobacter xixiisoli]